VSDQELNDLLKSFDNPNHCYQQRLVDAIRLLVKERDEARREVCFLLSRNVTQNCDGDTPEFHATARGWCYLLEEDDE